MSKKSPIEGTRVFKTVRCSVVHNSPISLLLLGRTLGPDGPLACGFCKARAHPEVMMRERSRIITVEISDRAPYAVLCCQACSQDMANDNRRIERTYSSRYKHLLTVSDSESPGGADD